MSFTIEHERPTDGPAIEDLINHSFGPGRKERTIYKLRSGIPPLEGFSFVARGEGGMLGSIAFWPVKLPDGRIVPILGPLAVLPELRGRGVGKALVRHGLAAVRDAGYEACLIVGDPGYYAPFGFSVEAVHDLTMPGPVVPLTFMAMEFVADTLKGLQGAISRADSDTGAHGGVSAA